jgi:hypothetical protein
MFGYNQERTVVFFVARSHADLSWYLSLDARSPAANDRSFNRSESHDWGVSGVKTKRRLLLRLIISQAE